MRKNSNRICENDVFSNSNLAAIRSVLVQEAKTIQNLAEHIPFNTLSLLEKIVASSGKIIFTGIGKSGLIGRKLSATFSSLGMPSFFLHPVEAMHGDLGIVQPANDLMIVLSKSGAGKELAQLIHCLVAQKNFVALICCIEGELAKLVSITITLPFDKEACHLNLAPTSSATLMLAFGDALAVAASSLKGFSCDDFACFHPSGSLGKNLLLSAESFMYKGNDLPLLEPDADFEHVLLTITLKKLGIGIVVDGEKRLLGIITDGDLRRACKSGAQVFSKKAQDIMTCDSKIISPHTRACEALALMEDVNITSLIVTEKNHVIGLVHIHDLVKAGISHQRQKTILKC